MSRVDVKKVRHGLGMTQEKFAARFGFPLGTLREWEQGIRQPSKAAQVLLRVISSAPEIVETAARASVIS